MTIESEPPQNDSRAAAGHRHDSGRRFRLPYRAEIDGLRAIAVIPIILFHAGFTGIRGGFLGVDIFFVISGYLITTIILSDLKDGRFSLVDFYERRARRILPALFFVMAATLAPAYFWMLTDELENYGQSLVAASLFSNNILLALTSGYWSINSELKPLLHTWSLAVEEQFYLFFPLLLMLCWRRFRRHTLAILMAIAVLSLAAAHWSADTHPQAAFYLLPTRAWELLIGAFVAFHGNGDRTAPTRHDQWLSALGLGLIVASLLLFRRGTPNPSLYTLLPTVGTALVILYARHGTIANAVLSSRPLVGVGLISYSAYLWHFPLVAFARIYQAEQPSQSTFGLLCVLTLALAYVSWRFVETPFRNKERVGRKALVGAAVSLSLAFTAYGLYLHQSRGAPGRMYAESVATGDDLYIGYNDRVFGYKKDAFQTPGALHVLVTGNSFARDFINMTVETFDTTGIEIVYRDDFDECLFAMDTPVAANLFETADIVVLGSGSAPDACIAGNIAFFQRLGKKLFYSGGKNFGYNLNWLARLDEAERRDQFNALLPYTIAEEQRMRAAIPKEHFISLLAPMVQGNSIRVTDEQGRLISADRNHLTRHGAIYLGRKALLHSPYGDILRSAR